MSMLSCSSFSTLLLLVLVEEGRDSFGNPGGGTLFPLLTLQLLLLEQVLIVQGQLSALGQTRIVRDSGQKVEQLRAGHVIGTKELLGELVDTVDHE